MGSIGGMEVDAVELVVDEWEVSDSWVIVQTQGSNRGEGADKNGRLACPI